MNRRNAPRAPLDAEVVLVTPGEHGPELSYGRTLDVSAGGCRVALDQPLTGATSGGVLLVRSAGRELAMLIGPVTGQAAAAEELSLRFVQPTEPDHEWSDFVGGLDGSA